MMERVNKLLITTALTLTVAFTGNIISLANASDLDLKERQQLLNKEIEEKQSELLAKKKEESSALSELKNINNTLYVTSKKLSSTNNKLSKVQQELALLEEHLAKSENNLNYNKDVLENRLTSIYVQGDVHILEVLLDSTSFTEFLTRWDFFNRLAAKDTSLIATIKDEIKSLEENRNLALVKKETFLDLQKDQNTQKQQLAVASSRQKQLYKSIKSERSSIQKALDDLEEESNRIESELKQLTGGGGYLGSGKMKWPTPGYGRVTSPYGWRIHPILKKKRMHTGVDIGAPYGASIVATEQGKVIFVGWRNAYGRVVMIDHGGGIVTMYAHTSKTLVNVGEKVYKGKKIAKIGTTGWSTGPHLHFEVRKNGKHVNPMTYLK